MAFTNFKDFLLSKFIYYFRDFDTNKDSNGDGTFIRYMSIFGEELDDNVIPDLTNAIYQKVPYSSDGNHINSRLLPYLTADLGGYPDPDNLLSETVLRKILANLVDIIKHKGTQLGYDKLFFFYGYSVILTIYPFQGILHDQSAPPADFDINHDTDDIGNGSPVIHDQGCRKCFEYDITLTSLTGVSQIALTHSQIASIASFVEPVNMTLVNTFVDPGLEQLDDSVGTPLADYNSEPLFPS